jgi:hypothetical protein
VVKDDIPHDLKIVTEENISMFKKEDNTHILHCSLNRAPENVDTISTAIAHSMNDIPLYTITYSDIIEHTDFQIDDLDSCKKIVTDLQDILATEKKNILINCIQTYKQRIQSVIQAIIFNIITEVCHQCIL